MLLLTCFVHLMFGILDYDINKRLVKKMSNLGMIPKLSLKDFDKCESCSQAKIAKTPYKSMTMVFKPLNLISSNICEFEEILTRNKKMYSFFTFIMIVLIIPMSIFRRTKVKL